MTNHVHLPLTPADARAVPRVPIAVGRRYVQHLNRTDGRTGTLWDSRDKSSLVQAETDLPLCQRYIALNPVRAGRVTDPSDWPWSGYRANALGERGAILAPHPLYLALGSAPGERREAYRNLFRDALEDASLADLRLALSPFKVSF